jgi:hypothetical protein
LKQVIGLLTFLVIISAVTAQGPLGLPKPVLHKIGLIGQGIAISDIDPSDFELIKAGIGKLKVRFGGNTSILTAGILWLGDERYRLKDIEMGNKTISGNLYFNRTLVGSFSVSVVMKGGREVWAGSLSVNEASYNVYILSVRGRMKPLQIAENVVDVCKSHPKKCREIGKGIGNICDNLGTKDCRDKIKEFCTNHSDDRRCVAVFRVFCKDNLDDSRCRRELSEFCKANPKDEKCEKFCENYPRLCKKVVMKKVAKCLGIYAPVCGADNRTYTNKCLAEKAGVEVQYRGRCRKLGTTAESEVMRPVRRTVCSEDGDCEGKIRCVSACLTEECPENVPVCVEGRCRCKIRPVIPSRVGRVR